MKDKLKKAVLLFEVALVVLLVSVASLFLFRGYSIFLRTGRRSLDYLKLALLAEEQVWDLHLKEKNNEVTLDLDGGSLDSQFNWRIRFEDTDYDNFKKGIVITQSEKRKESLDVIIYLKVQEE